MVPRDRQELPLTEDGLWPPQWSDSLTPSPLNQLLHLSSPSLTLYLGLDRRLHCLVKGHLAAHTCVHYLHLLIHATHLNGHSDHSRCRRIDGAAYMWLKGAYFIFAYDRCHVKLRPARH